MEAQVSNIFLSI